MKIINKVLVFLGTLGLTTGLAYAHFPAKPPTNIQEKLLWGLCSFDKKVIVEALQAGANPFTCHKTEICRTCILNTMPAESVTQIVAAQEISPYLGIFTAGITAAVIGNEVMIQQLFEIAEVLLKHGVSVDRKHTFLYGDFAETFRLFLEKSQEEVEIVRGAGELPAHMIAVPPFLNKFLELINQYQPKIK